jgi:hypothetical protein
MKNSICFLTLLTLLSIYSCSKDNDNTSDCFIPFGSDFFPDDSGITRIYQADSVYWDEFTGTKGVKSFEIKEMLAGYFTDGEGRQAMRIERFRKDSTGNWIIYRVWAHVKTRSAVEVTEENIRYVKLRFPADLGTNWNGNVYNTEGEQIYEIKQTAVADQISGLNFTNTLHVEEEGLPANLLFDKQQESRYAKGIGLYKKLKSSLNFDFISGDTISGYIYTEKLTSYSIP